MASTTQFSEIFWRRSASDACVLRSFDDGFVVYHRPSGKTHLLNEPSFRLLTELLLEPRNLSEIAAEFELREGAPPHEEYLACMAKMLRRLEQVGLIERA